MFQNTRYVVTAGARQKDEDWDPEENGGFAIHSKILFASKHFKYYTCHILSALDTDGSTSVTDPLAALEKTTDAQNHLTKVQVPRLESLQSVSQHYNSDPYSLSLKVRKRFRDEKKIEGKKKDADDQIRGRYGLPESLKLVEDDALATEDAKRMWRQGRQEAKRSESLKRRKLDLEITSIPTSRSSSSTSYPRRLDQKTSLRLQLAESAARRSNPFNNPRHKPDR